MSVEIAYFEITVKDNGRTKVDQADGACWHDSPEEALEFVGRQIMYAKETPNEA